MLVTVSSDLVFAISKRNPKFIDCEFCSRTAESEYSGILEAEESDLVIPFERIQSIEFPYYRKINAWWSDEKFYQRINALDPCASGLMQLSVE